MGCQTSGVSAICRNVPSARCIGMHDHSYQGQPLGSTASKLSGPFPLESCSTSEPRQGARVQLWGSAGKLTVNCMSGRGPVLLRGAMPAAMLPGRANGLYVGAVGVSVMGSVCSSFLRAAHSTRLTARPARPLDSASTRVVKRFRRISK